MRIRVEVLPWLSETLGGDLSTKVVMEEIIPEGESLRGLLVRLHGKHEHFGPLVYNAEKRTLGSYAQVAVNGAIHDIVGGLDAPLKEGDTVTFLPEMAGG